MSIFSIREAKSSRLVTLSGSLSSMRACFVDAESDGMRPVCRLALVLKSTVGRERAGAVDDVPKSRVPLWLEKLSPNVDGLADGLDAGRAGGSTGVVGAAELRGRKRKLSRLSMLGILGCLLLGKLSPDDRFGCFLLNLLHILFK